MYNVVGAQKAVVKVQTRIANKVKRTASGQDKDSVKDALRAMLSTVEDFARTTQKIYRRHARIPMRNYFAVQRYDYTSSLYKQ